MKLEKKSKIQSGQGSNATSLRLHNEKTVLHILRFLKKASRSDLAHLTNLSSQSLAMITSSLEKKRLINLVGKNVKGIGQPSFVYELNPEGAYSIGCHVGRRSLEMVLINFKGTIYERDFYDYSNPQVDEVIKKLKSFINVCREKYPQLKEIGITGLGIGVPNYLNAWQHQIKEEERNVPWDEEKFKKTLQKDLDFPIFYENDVNAATMGTLILGMGTQFANFLYLYLGTFIGGGVVIDRKVMTGMTGNAGNVGTILVNVDSNSKIAVADSNPSQGLSQLLTYASINHLRKLLQEKGIDVPKKNSSFFNLLNAKQAKVDKWVKYWVEEVSRLLAQAILVSNSILDFQSVILDSALPKFLTSQICQLTESNFSQFETTGLIAPKVVQGDLGSSARVLGSAIIPFYQRYVPNNFLIEKANEDIVNSAHLTGIQMNII